MSHQFGGPWTEEKLGVVQRYFAAYAQALKRQPFECWYIDAFAGSGARIDSSSSTGQILPLFGEEAGDMQFAKEGSVRLALKIEPRFAKYVFIESSRRRAAQLRQLETEFPGSNIEVHSAEANETLQAIFAKLPRQVRAAVFIDPYGMQVKWRTLEVLAATGRVDIALLFPTGPLNRMLTRDGEMDVRWAEVIDAHLGPCDWRGALYKTSLRQDLFEAEERTEKAVNVEGLRDFVAKRLREIFPYVHDQPVPLRNSNGSILYDLFIITANDSPKAKELARRLANGAIGANKQQRAGSKR